MNPNTPFDSHNFLKALECPVLRTPLIEAIHLHPCAHKVNAAVISMLTRLSSGETPCPVCRTPIVDSYPDRLIREIVARLAHPKAEEALPTLTAQIQVEDPPFSEIDYPGNGALFTVGHSPWKVRARTGIHLIRSMEFTATTPDPFLREICILGYDEGDIAISVRCDDEKREVFEKYMDKAGFDTYGRMISNRILLTSHNDLKKIYTILVKHNQFPEDLISLIRSLIEAGNWLNVTPLTAEEEKLF